LNRLLRLRGKEKKMFKIHWSSRWWGYLISIGMIVVVTVLGYLLQALPYFNLYDTDMLYIMCVALSAAYLGVGPSLLASFLSILAFDLFFIPPILSLTVSSEQGVVSLLILSVVTLTISCLSPHSRR
jgi:two-component system sensor histidine kinase KdpD